MTERINVLLLVTELNLGGAERIVEQLATRLGRQRYDVRVACLFDPDVLGAEIRAAGIPVTDLGMRNKLDLRAPFRLFRLLRSEGIQILHTHMIHANLLGLLVGRLAGVPIIITTRQNVNIGGAWRERVNRWLKGFRDAAIAVSEEVRAAELARSGEDPARLVLIPNAISLERFARPDPAKVQELRSRWAIDANAPVIGTVGRFREQKGHVFLLRAIPNVLVQLPDAQFLFVGDGPLYTSTRSACQELGLSPVVTFTGISHDIPEMLALLDLFVLPSLWEGLPLAILEAMAAGKPVVATRVGGVPELVEDGVTGLLVPPRDPDALADAIVRLLRDPDLRRRMGRAGQERVRRQFSVEQMVRRTEALYEELLREKAPHLAKPTGA